jgi:hypothetical protein
VDWWSYGVCLFEGSARSLPFTGNSPQQVHLQQFSMVSTQFNRCKRYQFGASFI